MNKFLDMRNSGTPYMRDILAQTDKGRFFDMNGNLYITVEAAQATPKTHEIRYYGGDREKVAILRNYTRTLGTGHNSVYGTMQVISDKPDMFGNCVRWVHFGLFNANFAFPLETDITDDSDEPFARALMVMTPRNLRRSYRFYSKSDYTETIRLIEAIALERRIDLNSDSDDESDFAYLRDM